MGEQMEFTNILWLFATLSLLATIIAGRRREVRPALGFAMLLVILWSGCSGLIKSAPPKGTPAGAYTSALTALGNRLGERADSIKSL